jgi:hypothetical protein
MGQKSPMTAAFYYVDDGIENLAQGVGTWPSLGVWGGQVRTQTAPLGIGKVGRVRLSHRDSVRNYPNPHLCQTGSKAPPLPHRTKSLAS